MQHNYNLPIRLHVIKKKLYKKVSKFKNYKLK